MYGTTKLNATDSAKFLNVSRQRFYQIKRKYKLTPVARDGIISYYEVRRLKEVKKLLNAWWRKRDRLLKNTKAKG